MVGVTSYRGREELISSIRERDIRNISHVNESESCVNSLYFTGLQCFKIGINNATGYMLFASYYRSEGRASYIVQCTVRNRSNFANLKDTGTHRRFYPYPPQA